MIGIAATECQRWGYIRHPATLPSLCRELHLHLCENRISFRRSSSWHSSHNVQPLTNSYQLQLHWEAFFMRWTSEINPTYIAFENKLTCDFDIGFQANIPWDNILNRLLCSWRVQLTGCSDVRDDRFRSIFRWIQGSTNWLLRAWRKL